MKAVVTGMIATYPVGGVVWDYGQYLLGLERLGFEVYYLEDTGWQSFDPRTGLYTDGSAYNADFLDRELTALSPTLASRWHFRGMDGVSHGMDRDEIAATVQDADLFLNVSGGTLLRQEYMASRRKVLIDTDPGWNHFVNYPRWDANPGWYGTQGFRAHDYFFTYAECIGRPGCRLPSLGIDWQPTRMPVVNDHWLPEPPAEVWTTVMTWDNFRRPIEYDDRVYGTKEMEFGRIAVLPQRVSACLEVAVGGDTAPRAELAGKGWSVREAVEVSADAEAYRHYIQRSRGELSVAKNVYVATHSGWFSCRSVCYLAAGRPVVLQETGFSDYLKVGDGLLSFHDLSDAADAIAAVEHDYALHSAAAAELAAREFASDRVLGRLLDRVGLG